MVERMVGIERFRRPTQRTSPTHSQQVILVLVYDIFNMYFFNCELRGIRVDWVNNLPGARGATYSDLYGSPKIIKIQREPTTDGIYAEIDTARIMSILLHEIDMSCLY